MIPNPSSAAEVEDRVQSARRLTGHPIGVGFLVPFVAKEAVASAAELADVVEFFYGDPDRELVSLAASRGASVGWQTGSAAEALAAAEAGCAFVIIQGTEAGGHVRGTQRIDEALAETLSLVDLPVVAAGGAGTARRVAELLSAGASAVRVGTRFVAANESDAHPDYVDRLIASSAEDTVLCAAFSVNWPDAPHRVLREAVDAAERFDGPIVATLGQQEVPRYAPQPAVRQASGQIGAMALYAGESVGAVTGRQPAAEIVAELADEL